jgi:hypothetical protein
MGIHCLMGYLGIIQPDSVDGMGLCFTFDHVWKGWCVTWSICWDGRTGMLPGARSLFRVEAHVHVLRGGKAGSATK